MIDLTPRTLRVDFDKEVKITKDYGRFKRIKGNRNLYNSHVKALVAAFEDNREVLAYNPILVNDKFEIIDGQHRLEAARELGMPVYYIIHKKLGLKDVQALNSGTKPWGPVDYALSYAELGKLDYKLYIEADEQYPVNHDILRYILSDGKCNYHQFKLGNFQVYNVKEAMNFLDKLMDFKDYYPEAVNRTFVFAFYKMFSNESYNHQHMISQLGKHTEYISEHFETTEYLRDLESLYNLELKPENTVRFF